MINPSKDPLAQLLVESYGTFTEAQLKTEAALKKKGFRFSDWLKPAYGGEEDSTSQCFMMIRKGPWGRSFAEVDPDGSVNGKSVEDFLHSL